MGLVVTRGSPNGIRETCWHMAGDEFFCGSYSMKKTLAVVATLIALPIAAQAQTLQYPGFYAGLEGGGTYMFNTNWNTPVGSGSVYPAIGWAAGGMLGYDFVGPRVE